MRPIVLHGHERPLTKVVFNREGDLLFTAAKDGLVNIWRLEEVAKKLTVKKLGTFQAEGSVNTVDVTYDSKYFLVASASMRLYIRDVDGGTDVWNGAEKGPVKYAEWCRHPSQQNKFVCCTIGGNPTIRVYHEMSAGNFEAVNTIAGFGALATQVHWGPFDQTIISGHEDGKLRVWDVETGEEMRTIEAHKGCINDISFTEDRMLMLTCAYDGTAKLWETAEFEELKKYQSDRPLNGCAISPLWNAATNTRQHVLLGGGQDASKVTTTAASEGKMESLFYHLVYGEQLAEVKGHFSPVNSVCFFPDGSGFVTGAEESFVRIHKFDPDYFNVKKMP